MKSARKEKSKDHSSALQPPNKKQKTQHEREWIEINTKISTTEYDEKKQKIEKNIPPLLKKMRLCSESIEIESATIHQTFKRFQLLYRSGPAITKTKAVFHIVNNKDCLFQFHESIQKQILDQVQLRGTLLSKVAYLPNLPSQLVANLENLLRANEALKNLLYSINDLCAIHFSQGTSQFYSLVGHFNYHLILISGFSKIKCIVKEYMVVMGQVYQLLRENMFSLLTGGIIPSKVIQQFPSQFPKYYIENTPRS